MHYAWLPMELTKSKKMEKERPRKGAIKIYTQKKSIRKDWAVVCTEYW